MNQKHPELGFAMCTCGAYIEVMDHDPYIDCPRCGGNERIEDPELQQKFLKYNDETMVLCFLDGRIQRCRIDAAGRMTAITDH